MGRPWLHDRCSRVIASRWHAAEGLRGRPNAEVLTKLLRTKITCGMNRAFLQRRSKRALGATMNLSFRHDVMISTRAGARLLALGILMAVASPVVAQDMSFDVDEAES